MKRGSTKLIDPLAGLMECELCRRVWIANIKPRSNGKFYRGSWQCPDECSKDN